MSQWRPLSRVCCPRLHSRSAHGVTQPLFINADAFYPGRAHRIAHEHLLTLRAILQVRVTVYDSFASSFHK